MSPGLRCAALIAALAAHGCAAPHPAREEAAPVADAVTTTVPCCELEPPAAHHLRFLTPAEVQQRFRFQLESDPPRPQAGRQTSLTVRVEDLAGDGGGLGLHRERRIHLTVAHQNLDEVHHVHPEAVDGWREMSILDGRLTVPVVFAAGGRYQVVADFVEDGVGVQWARGIEVDGPSGGVPQREFGRVRSAGDLTVSLETAEQALVAGREVNGVFRVRSSGEEVADLQPFGGALAHILVFGPSADQPPLHLHGGGQEYSHFSSRVQVPGYRGPKLYWSGLLERPGAHRVFLLIRRGGETHTVGFDLQVGAPGRGASR